MSIEFHVVPASRHDELVRSVYLHRGYSLEEAADAARFCHSAARHGIRTHNALKAVHLDDLFGSKVGRWVPQAEITKRPSRFAAAEVWDAHHKLGQSVAYKAMARCMELADQFGVGIVSVDNATHYLWGGGYVIDAALKGYIAYTNCTSATSEVVPFGGKSPTMGTNPHSWGFPTQLAVGFPIVIDWATSTVAMGRVQQFAREGKELAPGWAVDADGNPTVDPNKAAALLPFGAHKGYGLGLIDELYAAFIGGSLPSIRGTTKGAGADKRGATFFFQCIHPDAMLGGDYAFGRTQAENVKACLENILGPGNEDCLLPGQLEARSAALADHCGGLPFTKAEIAGFAHLTQEVGQPAWTPEEFPTTTIQP
jgi:LDH2 family malate/lactate/ureidoglycolate dehydrogenase